MALSRLTSVRRFGIDGDSLVVHLLQDRLAHTENMRNDRVPWKGVQKIESLVGDVIYGFDQEVTGTHGGIEILMLKARPRFPPDKLSFALRLISDPLFAQRFLFLKECFALLLRLAQLGSHRVKLLFQNRTDGMLDDVFDDVVRGVVGAGRLALVLVVFEIDCPFFFIRSWCSARS